MPPPTYLLSPGHSCPLRQHKADQEARGILLGRPLAETDLVFAGPNRRPPDPDTVTKAFARVAMKAGLPDIRFHDLRHAHASLLMKAGLHPKVVSERLGHASMAFTLDTYSHVVPGLQEQAARRFDELLGQFPDVAKILPSPAEISGRGGRI